jgi:MOSC domain-containing protein YiiM
MDRFTLAGDNALMILTLKSVNVAVPQVIAIMNDRPVVSAIAKQPVGERSVRVRLTNIEGDAQGDLSVHGGVDKAVYAYSAQNWPWWEERARACLQAGFDGREPDTRWCQRRRGVHRRSLPLG